jgi:hypothetical protein
METEQIPLTDLARALRTFTGREPGNYRKLWLMVASGELPAEKTRGRWFIKRNNLPQIARQLRLLGA